MQCVQGFKKFSRAFTNYHRLTFLIGSVSRYIGENARLILDIFEYCNENNEDGILVFLDFEKAFDSVEWTL